jgi:stage V sporulation protein B
MCGYTNSQAVSLYGIAVGMSLPILFIPNSLIGSIAVVIAPELSENFYKKRTNQLRIDIEKSLKSAIFIAVLLIPVLFSLGNDIGIWLYSNQLSGKIIKYFAFILLPMCISMISTTILNSMNKEVKTLIYFFISAIAMLVCTLLLTKNLGIYAYLIGLSLSFLFTAILNIRLLKRQCKGLNFSKYLIFSIIICLTACLFGMFLNNLFDAILTQFYKIFVVTLLILMFTLTFFYATEMLPINPLKSKIKPFKILSIKPFAKLREKH